MSSEIRSSDHFPPPPPPFYPWVCCKALDQWCPTLCPRAFLCTPKIFIMPMVTILELKFLGKLIYMYFYKVTKILEIKHFCARQVVLPFFCLQYFFDQRIARLINSSGTTALDQPNCYLINTKYLSGVTRLDLPPLWDYVLNFQKTFPKKNFPAYFNTYFLNSP